MRTTQLALDLKPPPMTEAERLRAAYRRARLERRMSFDRAMATPPVARCLNAMAEMIRRQQEGGAANQER